MLQLFMYAVRVRPMAPSVSVAVGAAAIGKLEKC